MKSLLTALLVSVAFLMSQPAAAVAYAYDVLPSVAGKTLRLYGGWGASQSATFNVNVTAEGSYDFTISGLTHLGLLTHPAPSMRRTFYTTVDAGQLLDATGAVVATLTSVNLPTQLGFGGIGTKLYANGVYLLPGTYQLNLTTSCNTLCSYSRNGYLFVINPSSVNLTPAITTPALPDGTIGTVYNAPVTYSNPTGYSTYVSVIGLPSGLMFNGWSIVGTPTVIGSSSITITATSALTNLATSITLPLTINDAAISFVPTLPDGAAGSSYTATLTAATGGTGSFTYTQTGLPDGLTLTGDTIAGTPTTAGIYTVDITATDGIGSSVVVPVTMNIIASALPVACSGTNVGISAYAAGNPGFIVVNNGLNPLDRLSTDTLNSSNTIFQGGLVDWYKAGLIINYTGVVGASGCILDSLTVKPSIAITTSALPNATFGIAYTAPLTITGGLSPYSTTVSGLPAGLSFDGTNIIGTATAFGAFPITVTSIDALGFPVSTTLTMTVEGQPITFAPILANGTVGTAYSVKLAATGGVNSFTYTATNLPAGLSLTGDTISGIPTVAGSYALTLQATDAAGVSSSVNASLVINHTPGNYTAIAKGRSVITMIGPDYMMVGKIKFIWEPSTTIIVKTPSGVKNTIDSFVTVGMTIRWQGLRDNKLKTVMASLLTIN